MTHAHRRLVRLRRTKPLRLRKEYVLSGLDAAPAPASVRNMAGYDQCPPAMRSFIANYLRPMVFPKRQTAARYSWSSSNDHWSDWSERQPQNVDREAPRERSEAEWAEDVKRLLRAEMARRGITYEELAGRLARIGVRDTAVNLRNKVARGRFSAVFLIQCLKAIDVRALRLSDDANQQ
jgi:hypothetical protein